MSTLAEIRVWVGREAMRGGKVPSGMTFVDAEELDALLASIPTDAVLVTPESLARALHATGLNSIGRKPGSHGRFTSLCICNADAAAILAAEGVS